jgi:SAM-dependent methyltransferase
MSEASRHDAWQAGENYEAYMGRWSRKVAPRFLDWLAIPAGLDWLEVGCGTGALSAAILVQGQPRSLLAIDPSAGFVAQARAAITDPRATFMVGDAQALDQPSDSRDVVVSALALNFIPDRELALAEMRRAARSTAAIGFYVWDYPGGGMEMMRTFWSAAAALDPSARELAEDRRFPFCTPERLVALAGGAGLEAVECRAVEVATEFRQFDDYWRPFTLGSGPAPGYCASLAPDARERLRQRLHDSLPRGRDGSIALKARAWAVKGRNG